MKFKNLHLILNQVGLISWIFFTFEAEYYLSSSKFMLGGEKIFISFPPRKLLNISGAVVLLIGL